MDASLKILEKTLRDNGYSATAPRRIVFSALLDQEPQTMAELLAAVASTVDRASLYRSIDLFERLGIVQRLTIGWKYKLELSDIFAAHHHHMSCLKCGSVASFNESALMESELERLATSCGFEASGHQLELRGLCAQCQIRS